MHVNETYLSFFSLLGCSELREFKTLFFIDWLNLWEMFFLLNRSVQNINHGNTKLTCVHTISPLLTKMYYFIISPCMANQLHFAGCLRSKDILQIDLSLMFYIFNNWFILMVFSENSICAKWNFLWWAWDAFYLKKIPLPFPM